MAAGAALRRNRGAWYGSAVMEINEKLQLFFDGFQRFFDLLQIGLQLINFAREPLLRSVKTVKQSGPS